MAHDLLFTNETEWYAQDLRALFAIFGEGVMGEDDLEVTAGGTGLSVDVAEGDALIASDESGDQGSYRVVLETGMNSADFVGGGLEPADGTDPRIDRIVARVYDDEVDGSGDTSFRLEVVTGTPTAGADLSNDDGIGALPSSSIPLARVLVEVGDTAVDSGNIADDRSQTGGGGGGGGIHGSSHEQDAIDPIPSLPTADEKAAMDNAATPADASNPFLTNADAGSPGFHASTHLDGGADPIATIPTTDEKDAMTNANAPYAGNPFATQSDLTAGGAIDVTDGTTTVSPASSVAFDEDFFDVTAPGGGVAEITFVGSVGSGGLPTRDVENFTTASLDDEDEHQEDVDFGNPSVRFIAIEASEQCRVRVYMDAADVAGDAGRPMGVDPTGDHGLLLDAFMEGVAAPQQYGLPTGTPASSGTGQYEFGNRFTFHEVVEVVGIRFWRAAGSSATTRTLKMWNDAGTLLATTAATAETGGVAGYHEALFSSPVTVTDETAYTFSYSEPDAFSWTGSAPTDPNPTALTFTNALYGNTLGILPGNDLGGGSNRFIDPIYQAGSAAPVQRLTPQVDGSLFDLPSSFPIVVTNLSGATTTIDLAITWLPTEAP